MNKPSEKEQKLKRLIIAVSVVIPVVVVILFRVRVDGFDFRFLPTIYASINALTAMVLVAAIIAIKQSKKVLHERLMKLAIALSVVFLILYVLYHMTSDSTPFGGEGTIRIVYFILLISHILLSVAIIPLVLLTFMHAWLGEFNKHKKLAKITFPIWLYVTISGVVVYLMISPYYP